MKESLLVAQEGVDTSDWVAISCEYGAEALQLRVPPGLVELTMKEETPPDDPQQQIAEALDHPIGAKTLGELVRNSGKKPAELTVAITVSDITRPVPYSGKSGMLPPILNRLERAGILRSHITMVVGTGTHRASTDAEKQIIFGEEILDAGYPIVDHDCEDRSMMVEVGTTKSGTLVYVNRHFAEADLKIATGLVESHFMAGVSGGRKAVCPGLVDLKTIQKFHGPAFLESPYATSLVLADNPCHKESLEVAQRVGVDFLVNVIVNKDLALTGIFAGDLVEAHEAAVRAVKNTVEIPMEREADIVLTHGGYVGMNHYQTAKAAVGAAAAVRQGGTMIIAAHNRDPVPIGGPEYRTLLHLLKLQGPEGYVAMIQNPKWQFVRDQWEPEVWARALRKVGEPGLIYCANEIGPSDFACIPGTSGYAFLTPEQEQLTGADRVREMVQNALVCAVYENRMNGIEPTVAFVREGPYAVPVVKGSEMQGT
ncbi:MAG: nickel-dependent lactate racemase [Candidatus Latescibacterota bacterium]